MALTAGSKLGPYEIQSSLGAGGMGDGLSIAFFAEGKLKTISVAGGPVSSVADAPNPRGGAWGADDAIVYTPDYRDALWIVHPHQADA
ncbi:MAG TPA: hypothetical protein VH022_10680, partial [Candidatus Acidoferrum sp.]|nr:hypothetical protein [Candidatus Acidoferrum sp.]